MAKKIAKNSEDYGEKWHKILLNMATKKQNLAKENLPEIYVAPGDILNNSFIAELYKMITSCCFKSWFWFDFNDNSRFWNQRRNCLWNANWNKQPRPKSPNKLLNPQDF